MGMAIYCEKTDDMVEMSYGGFASLRARVSDLCGEPWSGHYKKLDDVPQDKKDAGFWKEFHETADRMVREGIINAGTVGFLMQDDTHGTLDAAGCRDLLSVVRADGGTGPLAQRVQGLRFLLEECVRLDCGLYWA